MTDNDDIISDMIKSEQLEEQKCADNICQQKVKEKYRTWHFLNDILGAGG